jgi:hypothetical protein
VSQGAPPHEREIHLLVFGMKVIGVVATRGLRGAVARSEVGPLSLSLSPLRGARGSEWGGGARLSSVGMGCGAASLRMKRESRLPYSSEGNRGGRPGFLLGDRRGGQGPGDPSLPMKGGAPHPCYPLAPRSGGGRRVRAPSFSSKFW